MTDPDRRHDLQRAKIAHVGMPHGRANRESNLARGQSFGPVDKGRVLSEEERRIVIIEMRKAGQLR
jgi:hypothetical protein